MQLTNIIAKIIGYVSLLAMVIIPFMYMADKIEFGSTKTSLLTTTTIWFISATFTMLKSDKDQDN